MVRVVVAFSVTMTMTLISWFALERPLMRWSQRMENDRRVKLDASLIGEQSHSAPTVTSSTKAMRTTESQVEPTTAGTSSPPARPGNSLATDD